MTTNDLRAKYERLVGEKRRIERNIARTKERYRKTKRAIRVAEIAKEVVRAVALQTQSQLEYHISSAVSAALAAVFDDPYELDVRFEEKRGRTECVLQFVREDLTVSPLSASGYGAVDIASFALRVACWSMSRETRPVLILDEPFKHLKGAEQNRRAIGMMKQISEELGLQIITVSDERAPREDIIAGADRVFEVSIRKGVSSVKEIR